MGTNNHGLQDITIEYYEEATSFDVNKRNVNIIPRGIYSGGRLTKVSNTEVTLSPFTAEIGDNNIQISVKTSDPATLKAATLDSGDIDQTTPYLVLRWEYLAQQNNYVEVHAIASVGAAQANDIIIGKCVFSGGVLSEVFDYTNRTFLNIQNLFLRVEVDSELYVWLRAGRIRTSSGSVLVPEQRVGPFSVPPSPNSRIDLVYVDIDGLGKIVQGSQATNPVAPSYGDRLVVAQVRIDTGKSSIPAGQITDVRSFIAKPKPDEASVYSGGESYTFPGGRIEKDGIVSYTGSNKTITFATPFPNEIRNVQLTLEKSPWGISYAPVLISKNVNQIVISLGAATGYNIHWHAIGR